MVIDTAGTRILEPFTIFQSGQNNGAKIWVFDARGHFQIQKVTPDIDVTHKVIVQCYVPVVKNSFVFAGNLQMITNKF